MATISFSRGFKLRSEYVQPLFETLDKRKADEFFTPTKEDVKKLEDNMRRGDDLLKKYYSH